MIDRLLTRANDSAKKFIKPMTGDAKKRAEEKQKESIANRDARRAEQYETRRKLEVDTERGRRNEQYKRAFAAKNDHGDGGDEVDEVGQEFDLGQRRTATRNDGEESERERPRARGARSKRM